MIQGTDDCGEIWNDFLILVRNQWHPCPDWLALSSDRLALPTGTLLSRLSALKAIWEQNNWDWLENSNSSVSLDRQKLAQLIGNRQKLETTATSENFSRQIAQYFSASKVHIRTVPLCF